MTSKANPRRDDLIEAVVELKDRFPDMTDAEVVAWAEEYDGCGYLNPESVTAHLVLHAYACGNVEATRRFSIVAFGVDLT